MRSGAAVELLLHQVAHRRSDLVLFVQRGSAVAHDLADRRLVVNAEAASHPANEVAAPLEIQGR